MAIRVIPLRQWSSDPGNMLGVFAYALAVVSFLVQYVWPLGYSSFESFVAPALPWSVCIFCLTQCRAKPLRAYWWVLPSVLPALFGLLFVGLLFVFWSRFGFAP